jgi:S-(hydroxymethyl)glutathione dehydrogenase/alcohol dehydrogenase
MESTWELLRPGGVEIAVGMPRAGAKVPIRAGGLFLEKRLVGSSYGSSDPHRDIPRLMALIRSGELRLDPMVTEELRLDQAQHALENLAEGRGARQVIVYEH